jgi:ribosomal protein L21E
MLKRKSTREKGKVSFTRFFQKFKEGDYVAVAEDKGFPLAYSQRIQGRTGRVIRKRGDSYEVIIKDINKPKTYFIAPIHLKKIEVKQ